MAAKYLIADLKSGVDQLRLAYRTCEATTECRGTILLIHGFPQTSYQFRHVLPVFAAAGYRCVAPDYRGAGASSKTNIGYTKSSMAADMVALLDHLNISESIHIVGHDIGAMVAYAFASRYPARCKTISWGECPLPGTTTYQKDRIEHVVQQFHFIFHSVPDLPEALIAGKERLYIEHFLSKITYNLTAFSDEDVDYYVQAYSRPGAMRCAMEVYRAFEEDARENLQWVQEHGKSEVPSMVLSGEFSRHRYSAEMMALEVTKAGNLEIGIVRGAGHYLAEENPEDFARVVLDFMAKH